MGIPYFGYVIFQNAVNCSLDWFSFNFFFLPTRNLGAGNVSELGPSRGHIQFRIFILFGQKRNLLFSRGLICGCFIPFTNMWNSRAPRFNLSSMSEHLLPLVIMAEGLIVWYGGQRLVEKLVALITEHCKNVNQKILLWFHVIGVVMLLPNSIHIRSEPNCSQKIEFRVVLSKNYASGNSCGTIWGGFSDHSS